MWPRARPLSVLRRRVHYMNWIKLYRYYYEFKLFALTPFSMTFIDTPTKYKVAVDLMRCTGIHFDQSLWPSDGWRRASSTSSISQTTWIVSVLCESWYMVQIALFIPLSMKEVVVVLYCVPKRQIDTHRHFSWCRHRLRYQQQINLDHVVITCPEYLKASPLPSKIDTLARDISFLNNGVVVHLIIKRALHDNNRLDNAVDGRNTAINFRYKFSPTTHKI